MTNLSLARSAEADIQTASATLKDDDQKRHDGKLQQQRNIPHCKAACFASHLSELRIENRSCYHPKQAADIVCMLVFR